MSEFKEFQAKTLDEAISAACEYYNCEREKLEIDILEDSKTGIFGIFGARDAKIAAARAILPNLLSATNTNPTAQTKNKKNLSQQQSHSHTSHQPATQSNDYAVSSSSDKNEQARQQTKKQKQQKTKQQKLTQNTKKQKVEEKYPPQDATQTKLQENVKTSTQSRNSQGIDDKNKKYKNENFYSKEGNQAETASQLSNVKTGTNSETGSYQRPINMLNSSSRNKAPFTKPVREVRESKESEVKNTKFGAKNTLPKESNKEKRQEQKEKNTERNSTVRNTASSSPDALAFLPKIPLGELDQDKLNQLTKEAVFRLAEGIDPELHMEITIQSDRICVICSAKDSGLLIGKDGHTLSAIEYLATRIVTKQMQSHVRIQLEVGDYRTRQDSRLYEFAFILADRVRMYGKSASTKPLTAYQRRIVHLALQNVNDIHTRSVGEGTLKRVIVSLAKSERTTTQNQNNLHNQNNQANHNNHNPHKSHNNNDNYDNYDNQND